MDWYASIIDQPLRNRWYNDQEAKARVLVVFHFFSTNNGPTETRQSYNTGKKIARNMNPSRP